MTADSFLIRRLLPSESEQFRTIKTNHKTYYPKHDDWLDKAVQEISRGERVAFGVFLPVFESGNLKSKLVGTAILKKSTYAERIELKTFFIDTGELEKEGYELQRVQASLLNRIIHYCERKGFDRLNIELSKQRAELIKALHDIGFKVISIFPSKYIKGDYFYILEKELQQYYCGDPFDFYSMVAWILKYNYKDFEPKDGEVIHVKAKHSYRIEQIHLTLKPSGSRPENEDALNNLALRGLCLIFSSEDYASIPEDILQEGIDFFIVFSYYDIPDLADFCRKNRIKYLTADAIKDLLGRESQARQIYFHKQDVGGMVITVSPYYHEKLKIIARKNNGKMVYFLMGGIGRYADYIDEYQEDENIVLFYFPPYGEKEGGILGFSYIEDVTIRKPDPLWDEFKEEEKLLEESEYLFYTRYSEDQDIIGLECSSPILLDTPLDFTGLVKRMEGADAEKFYTSELTASGIVTSYISTKVRKAFLDEYLETEGVLDEEQEERALSIISYLREDSERVESIAKALKDRGINIWMDKADVKAGEQWEKKIRVIFEKSEFCILCLSESALATRGFFQHEIKYAEAKQNKRGDNDVYTIPVLLEALASDKIPVDLRGLHFVHLYEDFDIGIEQIIDTIKSFTRN